MDHDEENIFPEDEMAEHRRSWCCALKGRKSWVEVERSVEITIVPGGRGMQTTKVRDISQGIPVARSARVSGRIYLSSTSISSANAAVFDVSEVVESRRGREGGRRS